MIIASTNKNESGIPLQPMSADSSVGILTHRYHSGDNITILKRGSHQDDVVTKVFSCCNELNSQVHELLEFTLGPQQMECQAFIHDETVFLLSPFGRCSPSDWVDGEFQTCVSQLIELAESMTNCDKLVISISNHNKESLNVTLRAFLYLGFELINPLVYEQEPGFVLVGYEF